MKSRLPRRTIAAIPVAAIAFACASPALAADPRENQWEMQIGQQQYVQLSQQGQIITSSPYYNVLNPIAQRIAGVAGPQYFAPFHFILVNKRQPNAFAVPGGDVFVTMGMMTFAKSEDELAGVLCHEVSHDIHHDVYNNQMKTQRLQGLANMFGAVMWNNPLGQMAVGLGAGAEVKAFSRADESNADNAGAYTCAQAGYNPYGLVSLFERMQPKPGSNGKLEMLSDHPRDDHRVSDLENLFHNNPATFGRFSSDPSSFAALPAAGTQAGYPIGYVAPGAQGQYPRQQYPPQQYPPQQYPPQQYPPQQYPPQQYPPQQYPPQQYPPQQYPPQQYPGYPPGL